MFINKKLVFLFSLLLLPIGTAFSAPQLPILPFNNPITPNTYNLSGNLSGKKISITFATSGIDGKPHLTYVDNTQTLTFSGDQIRHVGTEIGTLVSVTTNMTVDSGSTAFTLLIPDVNLDQNTLQSPINTSAVLTNHLFSVFPGAITGQQEIYKSIPLTGTASVLVY